MVDSTIFKDIYHFSKIFTPDVQLGFSPSMMNSTREFWQGNGLWSRIEGIKPIFLEPQRKDALSATMKGRWSNQRLFD